MLWKVAGLIGIWAYLVVMFCAERFGSKREGDPPPAKILGVPGDVFTLVFLMAFVALVVFAS